MDQPEKLVFISLTNSMGGAEQCLQLVAEASEGHFVFLKKVNTNQLFIAENIKTSFITKGPLLWGFMMLPFVIYKYRKDHKIISSHAYLNAFIGFLKRLGYIKSQVIVRESTQIFTRFKGVKKFTYKLAYTLGYPGVDLVICQTNTMRNQLVLYNAFIDSGKVICIPNPVSLTKIYSQSLVDEGSGSADFICAAGRLIRLKGFDLLIKAFSEIAATYPSLNLLILGSGPEKQNLLGLINELQLNDRVILKGYMDNPYPYFKKARFCVVSSIEEGFPNVLLQMIALNTSIVTTLCAGNIQEIPGIIKVDNNSVEALAQGMKDILITNTLSLRKELDSYMSVRTPEIFLKTVMDNLKTYSIN
ncbi:MAG: hypothetical protein JWQ66_3395 [Mucilaginibacter sp.]|nr:hypothetical protein [Mucilaginibacter sp.]